MCLHLIEDWIKRRTAVVQQVRNSGKLSPQKRDMVNALALSIHVWCAKGVHVSETTHFAYPRRQVTC